MSRARFWLRWSWRDLRERWLLVVAIALVIAMGTGLSTGFGSLESWRLASNDASFATLNAHDLRVSLTEGSFARAGRLASAARGIPHAAAIEAAEERLLLPTQVDASRPGKAVLTPGRIAGVDVSAGGPHVDGIAARRGRGLRPDDAGRRTAVLESTYAGFHRLPAQGTIQVAGGRPLRYVGQGTSPEYFVVTGPTGLWSAEGSYAVLFTSLATAQELGGRPGAVNDLVLALAPGAELETVERELEAELERRLPDVAATVTELADEDAHRILYEDARNDQEVFNVFSLLVLAGAALAAFNLASRVVEAQRREIGIGMALGAPRPALALRPLLMGAQIALAGVALGTGAGFAVSEALRAVLEDVLPLPVFRTPFEAGIFARGAALGFLLPLAASAYPVWRGLRMTPVEAIQVGPRSARGGGLAPLLRRVPMLGGTFARMPLRNLLRAPRRTVATIVAIAAVIAIVVAFAGMLDSFRATVGTGSEEVLGRSPGRMTVALDRFYPLGSPVVTGVAASPLVAAAEPTLRLPARLSAGDESFDVLVSLIDPASRVWHPTAVRGSFPRGSQGILLAEEAARDLGVRPGDTVLLRHPRRIGASAFTIATTRLRVAGLHPNPLRSLAYLDRGRASLTGLAGTANSLLVLPAPGVTQDEAKRFLFRRPGVASVQPVSATIEAFEQAIDRFTGIIRVAEVAALLLALLIAYNSASIAVEERRREYATMLAFGLRVRTLLRMGAVEGALAGVGGTLLGIGLGYAVLTWVVGSLLPETFPDVGVHVSLSGESLVAAVAAGVVAMAAAPLLGVRRLLRMEIPATLRVVE